jgi:serine/threonine protein kinase/WD40 repeat protein
MNPSNPAQLSAKEIFILAAGLENSAEREAVVNEHCSANPELLKQVQRLLAAADNGNAGSPLDAIVDAFGPEETHANPQSNGSEQLAFNLDQTTAMTSIKVGGQIGRYRLMEQLGEGGMGVVYVAEQVEPVRRKVALKVIKPGMDSKQVIARFEAERQALALMDHMNIARVLDGGTTEQGLPYFVMELVRGLPITEYCDQAKATTRDRLALFIAVCNAVHHAHQKGIIHRDIKPGNVLVTLHDGKPVVKVIDFGVAKALHQQLSQNTIYTGLNQVVGTPLYMSPEQLELSGLDIDTRTDIYSLGVLLYELLTGATPFDRERLLKSGFDEMRRIIREEDPPRPSHRVTTLPKAELSTCAKKRGLDDRAFTRSMQSELDWITLMALEKDRNRRYASASALGLDVQRYLDNDAVTACPPSWHYRIQKLAHKNRSALLSIMLVVLGLIAAVVGTSWQAIRATYAESESKQRLANLTIEQEKTRIALSAAETAEEKQRLMRVAAEAFAKREQEAAILQSELREKAQLAEREAKWNAYVARLSPMQEALKAKDFGRLDTMLKESIPVEGDPDFRDWEWYYLRDRVDAVSREVIDSNFLEQPRAIAWNPVGAEFAAFIPPNGIDVWNAETLARTRRLECPWEAAKIAWSPSGKMIALGASKTCELVVLDASDGTIVWKTMNLGSANKAEPNSVIWDISWSSDSNRIAVGTRAGEIDIVNVIAKTTLKLRSPKGLLGSLAWHPNSDLLAVGLNYGERAIFDIRAQTSVQLQKLNLEVAEAIAWSPSGDWLATGEGNVIRITDGMGKTMSQLVGHSGKIDNLLWIDDGQLVSSSQDQTIRIWDTSKETLVNTIKVHDAVVNGLAVSSDRSQLLSMADGRIRINKLWPEQAENVSPMVTGGLREISESAVDPISKKNSIIEIKWQPNGARVAAVGEVFLVEYVDGGVGVWNATSMRPLHAYSTRLCKGFSWSNDGTQFLRAEGNFLVAEDSRTGIRVSSIACEMAGEPFAAWSPSTNYVVTHAKGMPNYLRSSRDAVSLIDWGDKSGRSGLAIAWSPSETSYVAAGWGRPQLFFLTGEQKKFSDGFSDGSFGVAWHPSAEFVAIGNSSGKIVIRDSGSLEILHQLKGHTNEIMDLAFSPNGRRLASASKDGTVRIWDFATGAELLQLTAEGVSGFSQVEWSPDGIQLASGTSVRELVIFGTNQLQATPGSATELETGRMVKAIREKNGKQWEWERSLTKLAWRDTLTKLQLAAGGIDGPFEAGRFERLSAELLASHSKDRDKFANLVRGWIVLIESHNNPESAVKLANRLLQYLSVNSDAADEKLLLAFRLETLVIAGQRTSESENDQQRDLFWLRAEEIAEKLTTQFPNDPTVWRERISISLLRNKSAVETILKRLGTAKQSEVQLEDYRQSLRSLHANSKAFASVIPDHAYLFRPGNDTAMLKWLPTVSEYEMKHGIAPTFMKEWTEPFLKKINYDTANHSDFYSLALCHLIAGNEADYREVCQKMLKSFSASSDAKARQFTGWTCALAPNALDDYSSVIELVQGSLELGELPTHHLGVLLYRAGEFKESRDELLKYADSQDSTTSPAYVWYFLSMAEFQLRNLEKSKEWFEKATKLTNGSISDQQQWSRLMTLRLLDAEVKSLIIEHSP